MAPVLLLLVLLAEAASDQTVVVHPGDDVILPCRAKDSNIRAVEWTRPDLEPDTVLLFRERHLNTDDQNPDFKDRVDLVDRDLKDGDVSLILKNVRSNDTGTYECGVKTDDDSSKPIATIRLQVVDQTVVVHPGDDVTLPCQTADSSVTTAEWTRPDLRPDYVLLYRRRHLEKDNQHPSCKDRVDLVDRDLKDGNVSLTLKNVNINDAGTYECRVAPGGSRRKKRAIIDSEPIRTVRLQVTGSPGDRDLGLAVGVPVGLLLLVAVALVGVLMYRRHKDKRSGPPADGADEALGIHT